MATNKKPKKKQLSWLERLYSVFVRTPIEERPKMKVHTMKPFSRNGKIINISEV